MRENWFEEYIGNDFGNIRQAHLGKEVNNWIEINMIGNENIEGEDDHKEVLNS